MFFPLKIGPVINHSDTEFFCFLISGSSPQLFEKNRRNDNEGKVITKFIFETYFIFKLRGNALIFN